MSKHQYPSRLRLVQQSSFLTDSFVTRLKTEYSQNSRLYGALSLAASTPLLSVLLPLALVVVLILSSVLPR